MLACDQRLVHTPFVLSGYWSPCAPLIWNEDFPTPLGGLSMSSRHEKAVSRTSLEEAVYAWPCENISRGRAGTSHSRPYQGTWRLSLHSLVLN
ncbi:unnamed protein product [Schistosoma curassoni]|uniref:Uncharacterized protein n=1 Tax=Schistosoma curassoni TaxID=6186 RepID=A0A183KQP5_9TREM|nr:unnamed protein product [Schistosoma curassoni]